MNWNPMTVRVKAYSMVYDVLNVLKETSLYNTNRKECEEKSKDIAHLMVKNNVLTTLDEPDVNFWKTVLNEIGNVNFAIKSDEDYMYEIAQVFGDDYVTPNSKQVVINILNNYHIDQTISEKFFEKELAKDEDIVPCSKYGNNTSRCPDFYHSACSSCKHYNL